MANIYYDPINGGADIQIYKDPQVISRVDLEAQRDALLNVQGLSDELRGFIASSGLSALSIPSFVGQPDPLDAFDSYIDDELTRLKDTIDYFDYESGTANLNVRTADWFLPVAVEDFTDETVGGEAVNAIEAENGGDPDPNDPVLTTWWQSESSGLRVITFHLRDYSKKLEGIRLRAGSAGDGRAQLQGVTIKAANALAMIDDPSNVQAEDVDFTHAGDNWMEHTFASPKARARYIRLECSESLHSNTDHLRIRAMQARVGIFNYDN